MVIEVLLWLFCFRSTANWIFFTSAPESVGFTFVWLAELIIPIAVCIGYLSHRYDDESSKEGDGRLLRFTDLEDKTMISIRSGISSLDLSTASTWLGYKLLRWVASGLEPFSKDDVGENIWLSIVWASLVLAMVVLLCIWGVLQGVIWCPTVSSFVMWNKVKKEDLASEKAHEVREDVKDLRDI